MKQSGPLMRLWAGLLLIFLLLSLFSGCSARENPRNQPVLRGTENAYTDLLLDALPGYRQEAPESSVFEGIGIGENLCTCLQVQAAAAAGQDGLRFVPHGLVTVVFAVDRDMTELRPDSWQALKASDLAVSLQNTLVARRAILASLAYGLEGPEYGKQAALGYLAQLRTQQQLYNQDPPCPVTLCFDSEAVRMRKQGRNLEILVPREGTLSFLYGTLGKTEPPVSRQSLLDAGLRLPDGSSTDPAYPEKEAYASAIILSDFGRFHDVTRDTCRDIRRNVFSSHRWSSADSRESILMFTGAALLVLLWAMTALYRSISRQMRLWTLCISGQMVLWLLLCCFKYLLPSYSRVNRLCWYAYYIFMMGLPLSLLHMAVVIGQPAGRSRLPGWFWAFRISYFLLLALIFTNDLHQLVFRLEIRQVWTGRYSYGPGYYLILSETILCFLLALGMLIYKSRKSPRKYAWTQPTFIAIILIAFNLGYMLGIPLCSESNLGIVFCFFSILFAEALLQSGLLPINVGYRHFFSFSPIHMQLLDSRGRTVLASAEAGELTDPQRAEIAANPGTSLNIGPDSLLHSCPICGGIAVWREDIRTILALQQQLQESIRQIERANALLQKQREVRSKKIRAEVGKDLFERLEADIEDQTRELSQMISSLPQSPQRKQQLNCIPLLLCHIKRRCNLFFLSQEGETMSSNELAVYIDELSEFASYTGVHALVRCGISGPIGVGAVTLCYDFYFFLLRWATQDCSATLIGKIEYGEDALNFSILASQGAQQVRFPDAFTQALQQLGAGIFCRPVEERDTLTLTIPGKGGRP